MAHPTLSWARGIGLRYVQPAAMGMQTLTDSQASVEVEPIEPKDPALVATIKSMQERGIQTLYGRWLIDGAPRVLLFDTGTGYRWLDEWKGDLWSTAGIPSPPGDAETNEAIVFGYLVAWFLGEVHTAHLNTAL
jgi:glycogen(starch) synthase